MSTSLTQLIEAKRAKLPAQTNAFRVADGQPWQGVFIDALADRLLVSLRDCDLPISLGQELEEIGCPVFLKQLDKDNKQAPIQIAGPQLPLRFEIMEHGVKFLMDMTAGYSQGIFLDQRDNRKMLQDNCREGMRVLNTFAYTGAFSVYAAMKGAQTTTLDLAQPCLDWCKENMQINGLNPEDHYFCKGDALHWLERFAKQQRQFDAIILDPPTFSRDHKGRVWRVERDYGKLVELAMSCLAPEGFILCSTNCRKLNPTDFWIMVEDAAPNCRLTSVEMPFDFDGEDYLKCIWVES
ncbi:MAG: class I SAM-dependent methyltransferase [Akkermansia sp.]